jgi:hypothetical protein
MNKSAAKFTLNDAIDTPREAWPQEWKEAFAEIEGRLNYVQSIMSTSAKVISTKINSINVEEIRRREADWQQRQGTVFETLAKSGWTVPYWTTPGELTKLSQLSIDDLDREMVDLYFGNEKELFNRVTGTLKSSVLLQQWMPLLDQSITCILRGEYIVPIPALLTIIEGFLVQMPPSGRPLKDTKLKLILSQIDTSSGVDTITEIWNQVTIFLLELYANSNFQSDPPCSINRHWILHGRGPTNWTAADVLRLLNALATIEWIKDFLSSDN